MNPATRLLAGVGLGGLIGGALAAAIHWWPLDATIVLVSTGAAVGALVVTERDFFRWRYRPSPRADAMAPTIEGDQSAPAETRGTARIRLTALALSAFFAATLFMEVHVLSLDGEDYGLRLQDVYGGVSVPVLSLPPAALQFFVGIPLGAALLLLAAALTLPHRVAGWAWLDRSLLPLAGVIAMVGLVAGFSSSLTSLRPGWATSYFFLYGGFVVYAAGITLLAFDGAAQARGRTR